MCWDLDIPREVGLLGGVSLFSVDGDKVGQVREPRGHPSEVSEHGEEGGSGARAEVEDEGPPRLSSAEQIYYLP